MCLFQDKNRQSVREQVVKEKQKKQKDLKNLKGELEDDIIKNKIFINTILFFIF